MTSNKNLMKMLASLCLISSLAILQSTILHSIVTSDTSNTNAKPSENEDTLRVKRDNEITAENIVKSNEETSLVLVKWFKSVIDGNLVLKTGPPNLEKAGTQNQDGKNAIDKPTKNFFEDCANDHFYNISDTIIWNDKGQFEGQGKIIYDRKAMCRRLHQIHSIEGNFKQGHPFGEAKITYRDGGHSKANFDQQGVLHGLFVRFWCKFGTCNEFELEAWRKPRHLKEISIYNKGMNLVSAYNRVSVQGVESLWGDCRFIPAYWGS